jgi:hypothetical protein
MAKHHKTAQESEEGIKWNVRVRHEGCTRSATRFTASTSVYAGCNTDTGMTFTIRKLTRVVAPFYFTRMRSSGL